MTTCAAMLLLLAAGLALRVEGLGNLSAWVDECAYYFLDAPDFGTYFAIVKFWAPDNVMLYYILFYGWHLLFGDSLFAMRMLTVVFGLMAIPLAWAIGRRVYNERAGWIAAVCVAISPFQIWHAQSIRPYGLCIPIVLLALYALLRVREGKQWWVLAWLCNLLLLWLHPFMAFLLPAQVLYVLALRPHGFRKAVCWSLAQVPVLLPPFLWMRPYLVNVPEAEADHLALPGLRTVLIDLVGDDVMRLSGEFPITQPAWLAELPHGPLWAQYNGIALMVLLAVLALAALPSVARRLRDGDPAPFLLAATAAVPVLLLAVLSHVWRPCLEMRYTPYAPIALYILAGAALSGAARPAARALVAAALLALIAFETALYVTGETHTRWRDASRIIATQEQPGDLVLVRAPIPRSFHGYLANSTGHHAPARPVRTLTALAQDTVAHLQRRATPGAPGHARVWAVIELPFLTQDQVRATLNASLTPAGIQQEYIVLPGMTGMLLGTFTAPGGGTAAVLPLTPPEVLHACAGLLAQVGLGELPEEEAAGAAEALARVIEIPVPLGKNTAFVLSVFLAEEGEYTLASAFAAHAIHLNPRYGAAHFAQGIAQAGAAHTEAALEAFGHAFALDTNLRRLYAPLVAALYREMDPVTARAELRRLAPTGFPYKAMERLAHTVLPQEPAVNSP